jgi:hypothetical protein
VVEAEGDFFVLVVTCVTWLPSSVIVPDAVEVDLVNSTLTNLSLVVFENDFSVSMLLVE